MISKRRLRSDKVEHSPWLRLINEDFDRVFYSDPKEAIGYLRPAYLSDGSIEDWVLPAGLLEEIHDAYESGILAAKWPIFEQQLTGARVPNGAIKSLFDDLNRSFDLPPVIAVTRGMRALGIPYNLARRKHATIAYRPYVDSNEIQDEEDFNSFDIELVFVGKSGAHSIHELGSGIKVIIPVIVALATAEVSLLSIEEPECHVHPKLQAELGDLIIQRTGWTYFAGPIDGHAYQHRWFEKYRLKSHLIVETHSEHLILRILRRIRETTGKDLSDWPGALRNACPNGITPEQVAVLYVEPGDEGAEVIELPVTPDGDFSRPWPGGFFAERVRELYSIREDEE